MRTWSVSGTAFALWTRASSLSMRTSTSIAGSLYSRSVKSEAAAAQHALEEVWARLYAEVDGARFERRGDLLFALYPPFPIPQCNGPWVVDDTQAAADGLAEAIEEVDASGASPWVQTR